MSGVILLGGGLDSTSLLVWLRKTSPDLTLHGFHVEYGHKAFEQEARANEYFCNKYRVPLKTFSFSLSTIASSSILFGREVGKDPLQNKLEGRNIILIALAATYASTIGADKLYVGFHEEPEEVPFPDATWKTYECMKLVLRQAYNPKIFLEAPFRFNSRLEVFEIGILWDEEILTKTFTCYEGGNVECGQCVHCKTKAEMVKQLKEQNDVRNSVGKK